MTVPVLQSAVVIGDTVTLAYDLALDRTVTLSPGLFSVAAGHGSGGPFSVTAAAVDGIDATKVVLHLDRSVSNGQFLTLSYDDPTNGVDDPNVVQSAANPADDAADATIVVTNNTPDTTAPSVAVTVDDATLAAGQTATVTFTFSEPPTGFTASDVSATNGATISAFSTTSDTRIYTAVLTPAASGAISVSVANLSYADAAGNAGAGGSVTLTADLVAPTVAIDVGDATLDPGQTTDVTFVFSETPTGFAADDVTVTNGATLTNLAATADPLVYTANLTPGPAGTVSISVADHSYTDAVGNAGSGDTETLIVASQPTTDPDGDDVINVLPGAGLVLGGGGNDLITGSDADDYLQGNTGDDTIYGGAGSDVILGGRDDDALQGNTGADTVQGNLGADTVHGGQGNDLVHGNEGDDIVLGDAGDDVVRGGQGADRLFGGDGADLLFGDLGSDTLTGGAGADQFWFPPGAQGEDLITDFTRADGDKIVISTDFAADFTSLSSHVTTAANGDAVITLGSLSITLAGVTPSSLTVSDFLFV